MVKFFANSIRKLERIYWILNSLFYKKNKQVLFVNSLKALERLNSYLFYN